MKNILVLNGHPNPDDSTAGKAVLEAFRTLRPDAKVRTLAALCGSDGYDVAAEQAAKPTSSRGRSSPAPRPRPTPRRRRAGEPRSQ